MPEQHQAWAQLPGSSPAEKGEGLWVPVRGGEDADLRLEGHGLVVGNGYHLATNQVASEVIAAALFHRSLSIGIGVQLHWYAQLLRKRTAIRGRSL